MKNLRAGEEFNITVDLENPDAPGIRYRDFTSTDVDSPLAEYPNRELPIEILGQGQSQGAVTTRYLPPRCCGDRFRSRGVDIKQNDPRALKP